MRTLQKERDRRDVLERLTRLQVDSQRRWGRMSAHQMICHLADSLRAALGEKPITYSSSLFKRTIYKWAALWAPLPWPHGIETSPQIDPSQGGTQPTEFGADVDTFRALFARFCGWTVAFAPHAWMGTMTRAQRMRHAYLHIDHHFRQFGI